MTIPGCFSPELTGAANSGAYSAARDTGFLADRRLSNPDVLDSLANLSSDEVFTPPSIARAMLDLLPDEVWHDKDLRWLDPAVKSGVFLREAARRLMEGLADVIPDEGERREHIFKNMLHGIAITELTGLIGRRTLYYSKDASSKYSVVKFDCAHGNILQQRSLHTFKGNSCTACGAPKSLERGADKENYAYPFIHEDIGELFPQLTDRERFPNMKFDVIIGNPPYQLGDGGNTSASPLYHHFVRNAIKLGPRYISFIIPSRWFNSGKGLDGFREEMLSSSHISRLVDYPDAREAFPGVEIKGGVCYFLWDRDHSGPATVTNIMEGLESRPAERNLGDLDVFVRFSAADSILKKVREAAEPSYAVNVSSQTPFGLYSNFNDHASKRFSGAVKLYIRGGTAWVSRGKIDKNRAWVDEHKLLLPKASDGSGSYPVQVLGKPVVAPAPSACTQTYLVAGRFASEAEAENAAAYLQTRFVRFLVSTRKTTQDVRPSSFAFVPKLDMAHRWTDQDLYERYALDEEEIAFIEKMIKEMPA
jgi:adenine-specific DNA methylase